MLYTVGYEGLTPKTFWSKLVEHGVETVVDVRINPLSRKPGFSKTPLSIEAAVRGIGYQHWRKLGCPREILLEYRANQDWDRYTVRYWEYLRTQEEEVRCLAELARMTTCCLVCFERDPAFCHRSFVADFVLELEPSISVTHITEELALAGHQTSLFK